MTKLKHIYDDHTNVDMAFQQYKDICAYFLREKYGFLVIGKDCEVNNDRYRRVL